MAAKKKSGLDSLGINEVLVSFGVTANVGNYESVRVDLSVKAAVPDGVSVEEHHEKVTQAVTTLFDKQADVLGSVARKILKETN